MFVYFFVILLSNILLFNFLKKIINIIFFFPLSWAGPGMT